MIGQELQEFENGVEPIEAIRAAGSPQNVFALVNGFLLPHEIVAVKTVDRKYPHEYYYFPEAAAEELTDTVEPLARIQRAMLEYGEEVDNELFLQVVCNGIRRGPIGPHYDPSSVMIAASITLQELKIGSEPASKATVRARRDFTDGIEAAKSKASDRPLLIDDPITTKKLIHPGDLVLFGEGVYHEVAVPPVSTDSGLIHGGFGKGAERGEDRLALTYILTKY